jgi:hypothetical protein
MNKVLSRQRPECSSELDLKLASPRSDTPVDMSAIRDEAVTSVLH